MRVTYDAEIDAVYVYIVDEIGDGEAVKQERLGPGVLADRDADGRLLGVEVLDVSTPGWLAAFENANFECTLALKVARAFVNHNAPVTAAGLAMGLARSSRSVHTQLHVVSVGSAVLPADSDCVLAG